MVVKILATLGFFVLAAAVAVTGKKLQKVNLQQIAGERRGHIYLFVLSVATLLFSFSQFWLLTGVFPTRLILLLLGAAMLGNLIYVLIGAVSGFTLEDKKKKIGALALIWGAHRPLLSCGSMLLLLLATGAGWIGAIWVFWSHPTGHPSARVLIAFFHFVLPQLAAIPALIAVLWPVVTSEYLDDDFRNARLAQSFASIVFSTIYLLFPVWLFQTELTQLLNWTLPPFWVLVSIPLLVFALGSLLPFFLGLYRHRIQARILIEWRTKWLKEVQLLLKLPVGEERSQALKEKLNVLQAEIEQRFSENDLFRFYQNLVTEEMEPEETLRELPELAEVPEPKDLPADADETQLVTMEDTAEIKRALILAKSVLTGKQKPAEVSADEPQEQVIQIIRDNQAKLVEWDIRFNHLWELLELYRRTLEGNRLDISGYVEGKIKQSEALKPKRNLIAGGIVTAITTVFGWVVKTYQDELIEFVGLLVR